MSDRYTLNVTNESDHNYTYAVFQEYPNSDLGKANIAWKTFNPIDNNSISWEPVYSVYASNLDQLDHGAVVDVAQYTMVSLDGHNGAKLEVMDQEHTLEAKKSETPSGGLTIEAGMIEQPQTVGLALGGMPVSAMKIDANESIEIQPESTFYVAQGNFKPGEIMNVNLDDCAKLDFSKGLSLNVVHQIDGTWSVS